jgi:hypothetical protein
MKLRNLLVAATAAAILAGTSFGASAGSWNFSKGESSSGVVSVGVLWDDTPIAVTLQKQHNKSVVIGDGGAGAFAGTGGGATAGTYEYNYATQHQSGYTAPNNAPLTLTDATSGSGGGTYATAGGSTFGGSCAGSGCGSNDH